MRTILICHNNAHLDKDGLARWIGSFSDLVGIIVIHETKAAVRRRVFRQFKRVGFLRFLDILAFRLHYRLFSAKSDAEWEKEELAKLQKTYREQDPKILNVDSPNHKSVTTFMRDLKPDIVIARTKFLIKKRVYDIPSKGIFVMHPGVCPQYRNAHGCFWALSNRDLENVGVTLLRIDDGIDTGPVYGIYGYPFDEKSESHHRIQERSLLENLDQIKNRLLEISESRAVAIDRQGEPSATWGQPWFTKYIHWKRTLRKTTRS